MHRGYIKLWRKSFDNPLLKNSGNFLLWVKLLTLAAWANRDELFNGKLITCKPGQFTTGRKFLSVETGISESRLQRVLKVFENCHMIEQQTTNTNRLITITNWDSYQMVEQQMNNKRTTNEQQMNTLKELKELKEDRITAPPPDPRFKEIIRIFCEGWEKVFNIKYRDIRKDVTALKTFLIENPDISVDSFFIIVNKCFQDRFHKDKTSIRYVCSNYSRLEVMNDKTIP